MKDAVTGVHHVCFLRSFKLPDAFEGFASAKGAAAGICLLERRYSMNADKSGMVGSLGLCLPNLGDLAEVWASVGAVGGSVLHSFPACSGQ